jgi:hypothetical protein
MNEKQKEHFEAIRNEINTLIMRTPTSEARNALTDINIRLMLIDDEEKQKELEK